MRWPLMELMRWSCALILLSGCHVLIPFQTASEDRNLSSVDRAVAENGAEAGLDGPGRFDQKPPGDGGVIDQKKVDGGIPCLTTWALWVASPEPGGCQASCAPDYSISCKAGGSCLCSSITGPLIDCQNPSNDSPDPCLEIWQTCCKTP